MKGRGNEVAMRRIELAGGGGRTLRAELVTPSPSPTRGVVMLPGRGYTCAMPAFYYIEEMALRSGAAVLSVDADYRDDDRFDGWPVSPEARGWLRDDARAAVTALLEAYPVRELLVVAKSLTTVGLAGVDWSRHASERTVRLAWLTPLLRDPGVMATLTGSDIPSLVSIGTADSAWDDDAIARLRRQSNVTLDVIDGADHSYGHRGDIDRSLASVGRVVQSVRGFAFSTERGGDGEPAGGGPG
jgi:hypothetical protein